MAVTGSPICFTVLCSSRLQSPGRPARTACPVFPTWRLLRFGGPTRLRAKRSGGQSVSRIGLSEVAQSLSRFLQLWTVYTPGLNSQPQLFLTAGIWPTTILRSCCWSIAAWTWKMPSCGKQTERFFGRNFPISPKTNSRMKYPGLGPLFVPFFFTTKVTVSRILIRFFCERS